MALLQTFSFASIAEQPAWLKAPIQKSGQNLSVVGLGEGSTIDLARRMAHKSCVSSAADFINDSFTVNSTSVQSEKDVALFDEVSSNKRFDGLKTNSLTEYSENKGDSISVWLKCDFDLASVHQQTGATNIPVVSPRATIAREPASVAAASSFEVGSNSASDVKRVMLSVSPLCDTVLVTGGSKPRIIRCDHNPVAVIVEPGETKLVITAPNFKPKTLKLDPQRTGTTSEESYAVILDR
jgi:hypothetical protein